MDISLKHPFSMLVSGRRGCRKNKICKVLLKSKLIAPTPERIVYCYAKYHQDLLEELIKMNMRYVESISGELDKYFKKNERNIIILDNLTIKAIKES